ncbi:MAG: undecaprenyl-diphosphate phosphatase [Minwuiales bacterium]|nr:undecaprenyl-diphosphate phosphatase [Minwuiales bacterium]
MTLLQIVVLSVIQGITEFLPISSSGHLVLVPALTGWPDQGPLIDVAVHVGTLLAVMLYFWRDMGLLLRGAASLARGRIDPGARLLLLLGVGTVPIVLFGAWLHFGGHSAGLRSAELIGWTMLLFGVVLYWSDRVGSAMQRMETLTLGQVVVVGLAQALALIPGTSRSGICITAARFLGFERGDAARLAMLLAIPTILAAGLLGGFELWKTESLALGQDALIAAILAFVTALIAIWAMMRWLQRATYTPFVVYRIVLGAGLLIWVYAG